MLDVAGQVAQGQTGIVGLMLESFLVEGRQDISGPEGLRGLVYGQSVTDACMRLGDDGAPAAPAGGRRPRPPLSLVRRPTSGRSASSRHHVDAGRLALAGKDFGLVSGARRRPELSTTATVLRLCTTAGGAKGDRTPRAPATTPTR